MWECPQAQMLWHSILTTWQLHGLWLTSDPTPSMTFLRGVFGLKLPAVPPRAWNIPTLAKLPLQDHRAMAEVFPTLHAAWQQQVLTTFLVIKQWRDGFYDPDKAWTAVQARAAHTAAVHQAMRQLSYGMAAREHDRHLGPRLITELLLSPTGSMSDPQDEQISPSVARYLLYFDGGSRGNPVPGGAGAVILATDVAGRSASVIWSASMSYGSATTTTNQAE